MMGGGSDDLCPVNDEVTIVLMKCPVNDGRW